jgi:hypothetical protein
VGGPIMGCDLGRAMRTPATIAMRVKLIGFSLTIAMMMTCTLAGQTELRQPPHGPSETRQALGTHATRGIVQTIDANTMVIVRPRNHGTMTFSLNSSTHREGLIVAGAAVSVRYREVSGNHVATAIALQRPKE